MTINNKKLEREENIIIFGNKNRLLLMKNNDYNEYYIDSTFKIIPRKFNNYKLLTIATNDISNNLTLLIGFVCFKYQDSTSYYNIFKYLNELYNFNPKIIHSDFQKSIGKAINISKFFTNNVIQVKCFFHFINALKNKMKIYKLIKKENYKEIYAIINNILLLCFIDEENIEKLKLIILNKLDEHRKYDKFISYLKRTWFKKGRKDFNYSKVIKEYYNNIKIIDKMYLTNNIIESLHSKINSYLPKHKTTVYNFIKSLENVIFNDTIKNNSVKRYDFKTRSLLILIDKENLNNNVHWVDYEVFIKYLNAIN